MVRQQKKTRVSAWPGSKPTNTRNQFTVTISKTVTIELNESVVKQGRLPGGPIFGDRKPSEKEVVEHLAFNLVVNGLRLSQIDGYANCPDESADVFYVPWDVELED